MSEREQIEQSIAALQAQRAVLGDAVVNPAIAALQDKLAALDAARQAPPPHEAQKRRQVTVLFADVHGFTAMSETMDVEDVHEMINALWQRLDAAILSHGGHVDKHMGDAVMAIWGMQTAREDDPEQAIRAALAMQAELRALASLQMRIGLNTGPVLLTPVGTAGELTALGDAVNVASRLEHAAPVGGILISHDTYRHVRGVFNVQALEPIAVKGKTAPLRVYLVESAKPRAFRVATRGIEELETRTIGREAELGCLQDALRAVMQENKRQVVTIVGEAGVGKSRLLYEFDNWIELLPETIGYFAGRASQEMQNLPYALLRDLFSFRFQIQDSDPAKAVREKIERGVGEVLGATPDSQMRAHFIGQLLGFDLSDSPYLKGILDDARQLRDRALAYMSEFFQAVTAQHPTVIFLEDIHWADDSSLDVVNHLAWALADRSVLVVCLTRPTLFERRPHWGEGQTFHTRMDLLPLSKENSARLVNEILQKVEEVPSVLREMVVSGAEGNPFYMEELVKVLIEDKVIVKEEERWRVETARLASLRVPPTLTGILQARLDGLPAAERLTLQQASVIGYTFWDEAIEYLAKQACQEPLPTAPPAHPIPLVEILRSLRERELIFHRQTSSFAGTVECAFKHTILRQVTYASVLRRDRRAYHACIAEWLMSRGGERAGEYTGLIADHLELAGRTDQAALHLRLAGQQAAARFANSEALAYLERALSLTPDTEAARAERYAILALREKVYHILGRRDAQRQDLETMQQLADGLDDAKRTEVALRWTNYAEAVGDYPAAIAAAQRTIRLARACQATGVEASASLQWGRALGRQGDYEAARQRLEQALNLARSAQSRRVEADCLRNLGIICWHLGDYAQDKSYSEQALHIYREVGDQWGIAASLNNLGIACAEQGDRGGAQAYYEQALQVFRQVGARQDEGRALNNLGNVCMDQGDYAQAADYYEQSLDIARQVGNRQGEGTAQDNLGAIYFTLGIYAQAQACYEQSLRIFRGIGDRQGESMVLTRLGLLAYYLGQETAGEYIQQALRMTVELGDRFTQGYALTSLGHFLADVEHLITQKSKGPLPPVEASRRLELAQAADAYQQAIAMRRELGQHKLATENLAALALALLALGDPAAAAAHTQEVLHYLESGTLEGADAPFQAYLSCYRVLCANQDPRARAILDAAYNLLQEHAAKISDPEARRSFLEQVTAHREIVRERQNLERGQT